MLDTNMQFYAISDRDDGKYSLKDKLSIKIVNEYNDFIRELYKLSPEEIVDKSYEKVAKEEIVYIVEENDYSDEKYKLMLNEEDLLDGLYNEWLTSDGNFNELLGYSIERFVNYLVQKSKENRDKGNEIR